MLNQAEYQRDYARTYDHLSPFGNLTCTIYQNNVSWNVDMDQSNVCVVNLIANFFFSVDMCLGILFFI